MSTNGAMDGRVVTARILVLPIAQHRTPGDERKRNN
jgi:hypothetical protein